MKIYTINSILTFNGFLNLIIYFLRYAFVKKTLSTLTIELVALLNVSVILIEKFTMLRGLMPSFGIIIK